MSTKDEIKTESSNSTPADDEEIFIDAKTLHDNLSDYVLIDIRQRYEHEEIRIPHTDANIPIGILINLCNDNSIYTNLPELKEHQAVLYCQDSSISLICANLLHRLLGGTIKVLTNGLNNWINNKLPIKKGAEGSDTTIYGKRAKSDQTNVEKDLLLKNEKLSTELKLFTTRLDKVTKNYEELKINLLDEKKKKRILQKDYDDLKKKNKPKRRRPKKQKLRKQKPRRQKLRSPGNNKALNSPNPAVSRSPRVIKYKDTTTAELNNALQKIKNYQKQIKLLKIKIDHNQNIEKYVDLKNENKSQEEIIKNLKLEIHTLHIQLKKMDLTIQEPNKLREALNKKADVIAEEIRINKLEVRKLKKQHEFDELHMRKQQQHMIHLEHLVRANNERNKSKDNVSITEKRLYSQIRALKLQINNLQKNATNQRMKSSIIIERTQIKYKLYSQIAQDILTLLHELATKNKSLHSKSYIEITTKLKKAIHFKPKFIPKWKLQKNIYYDKRK